MSAGIALPKQVYGHGFLLSRGEKMSKSVGNVVDPMALAERFGVDALRYFLLREVTFGQDGSYSAEAIVNRVNAELANSFGNLAQRTLSMIFKNLDGVLPAAGEAPEDRELARLRSMPPATELAAALRAIRFLGRARSVDGRGVRLQRLYRRRWRPGRCARPIRSAWRRCSGRWSWRCAKLAEAVAPVIPASAEKLLTH